MTFLVITRMEKYKLMDADTIRQSYLLADMKFIKTLSTAIRIAGRPVAHLAKGLSDSSF